MNIYLNRRAGPIIQMTNHIVTRCSKKITGLVFCGTNDASFNVESHIAGSPDLPLHISAGWMTRAWSGVAGNYPLWVFLSSAGIWILEH